MPDKDKIYSGSLVFDIRTFKCKRRIKKAKEKLITVQELRYQPRNVSRNTNRPPPEYMAHSLRIGSRRWCKKEFGERSKRVGTGKVPPSGPLASLAEYLFPPSPSWGEGGKMRDSGNEVANYNACWTKFNIVIVIGLGS